MRWEDAVTWVGEDGGSADAGGTMAVADLLHALAGGKPEESAGAADAASEADGEQMRRSLVRDLSLALMFLTSWEEKGPGGPVRRCWKGFDWDAVDSLHEDGLIDCSNKAKSLCLTDEGAGLGAFIAGICAEAVATAREEIARELLVGMPVSNERAFRLRVELDLDGLHDCWRELVVPARFTFAELHEAIQAAFLWWNYHLYDFELTSRGEKLRISDPDQGGVDAMFGMMFGGSIPKTQVDAHDIRLDDVFPRTRIARYSYDYGDGWEHRQARRDDSLLRGRNARVHRRGGRRAARGRGRFRRVWGFLAHRGGCGRPRARPHGCLGRVAVLRAVQPGGGKPTHPRMAHRRAVRRVGRAPFRRGRRAVVVTEGPCDAC